jgi:HK97 family phage prohead protease
MRTLGTIRGYANVFNEFSTKLDGDEPLREKIRPGAFQLLRPVVTATVAHCSAPAATTWNRSLRLWQDSYGLAFEMDVEATLVGMGLRDLVARDMNAMSFGLINLDSHYFRDEDGVLCREITRCDLDHVSVVAAGAFPSACCWLSDMPADHMSPKLPPRRDVGFWAEFTAIKSGPRIRQCWRDTAPPRPPLLRRAARVAGRSRF